MSYILKRLPLFCLSSLSFAHSGDFHSSLVTADLPPPLTSSCEISIQGDKRVIDFNGIPNHLVGAFPNRGNPHAISEQHYHYEIPAQPQVAEQATRLIRQPFGIALNGVLFDPGTAEFYQGNHNSEWNYEALSGKVRLGLDENHAHVQPNGAYHYHGLPTALFNELAKTTDGMTLLGWAADGFPMYGIYGYKNTNDPTSGIIALKSSYRIKNGTRPTGTDSPSGDHDGSFTIDYEYVNDFGDLDECGGRFGVTPEFPDGTYYYVLTEDYPFIPRMFRGTPDTSFERRRDRFNGRPPSNDQAPKKRERKP